MRKIVLHVVVVCALCALVIANHDGHAQTTMLPSIVETLAHPVQPPAGDPVSVATLSYGPYPAATKALEFRAVDCRGEPVAQAHSRRCGVSCKFPPRNPDV